MLKEHFLVFLLCLLFAFMRNVYSLECIQCTGPCKGSETSTECELASLNTCMKIQISFPGFSQTQRTCATSDTCTEASYGLFGMGFWTTCCTTDGCNSANYLFSLIIKKIQNNSKSTKTSYLTRRKPNG
ncbi:hypothetical protein BpHYR1_029347 [Brachionus plicatilis]|uniref:UPAR/Ly6 domain-containing protein n=1 Tax=Brachionus plicatilis TaxID=10195 RepID=A0A3M7RTH7_BRAPC|nr:hypothetical protein BpHYR1_029347 [Brachionus plicatilis]